MLRRRTHHAFLLVLTLLVATTIPLLAASPAPTETATASSAPRDVLFDESFRVREGGTLHLDLGSEAIDIRTVSGDRARVTVEGSGRDARSEFERRRFSARSEGRDLVVRTDPRRNHRSSRRVDARFRVTIEIPRRYSADLDLGSGSTEVASLVGNLSVDSGSGSVRLHDVDGGRIVLDTGSGSVRAGTLRGDVEVDSGSGSIEIDRVEGSFTADTGSGSIEIGVREGTSVDVDGGSGSVTIRVPRRAGFDLRLSGGSIRIDDALDFEGRRERRSVRGELRRGGATIQVDSGSGGVRLVAD